MGLKRMICACVLSVLFFALGISYGDDTDGVQALFDAEIRLVNTRNSDAFAASAHADIVVFSILSPFVIRGKAALQQVVQEYFATHAQATMTLVNPQVRVAGGTAIAWGYFTLTDQPKGGLLEAFHGRYTLTYTKHRGRWLLVAMHLSSF